MIMILGGIVVYLLVGVAVIATVLAKTRNNGGEWDFLWDSNGVGIIMGALALLWPFIVLSLCVTLLLQFLGWMIERLARYGSA